MHAETLTGLLVIQKSVQYLTTKKETKQTKIELKESYKRHKKDNYCKNLNRSIAVVYSFNNTVHGYKMAKKCSAVEIIKANVIFCIIDRKISCDRMLCSEALHNF